MSLVKNGTLQPPAGCMEHDHNDMVIIYYRNVSEIFSVIHEIF